MHCNSYRITNSKPIAVVNTVPDKHVQSSSPRSRPLELGVYTWLLKRCKMIQIGHDGRSDFLSAVTLTMTCILPH